ncbi:MAG: hypothetical protein OXG37_01850 [Actinomycetia bacterium]|nr:hypothetical protein [Actinomycetes bacterium]
MELTPNFRASGADLPHPTPTQQPLDPVLADIRAVTWVSLDRASHGVRLEGGLVSEQTDVEGRRTVAEARSLVVPVESVAPMGYQ